MSNTTENPHLQTPFIDIPELSLRISTDITVHDVPATTCFNKVLTLKEFRRICAIVHEQNLPFTTESGEWLADFVNYSVPQPKDLNERYLLVEYVSRPDSLVQARGIWTVYGGTRIFCLLPPSGWVIPNETGLLYDFKTGLPFETTTNPHDASESQYAYFWRGNLGDGLRAVNRECERITAQAFEISTVQDLSFHHPNIGYRPIERLC